MRLKQHHLLLILWCGALLSSLQLICPSPLAGAVDLINDDDDDLMDLDTADQPKADRSKAGAADAENNIVRGLDSILDTRAETPAAESVQEDDTTAQTPPSLTKVVWEEIDEATAQEELSKNKKPSLSASTTSTTADEAPPVTVDTKKTDDDKASSSSAAAAAAADFDDDDDAASTTTTTTTTTSTTSSSIPIRPELVGLTNDQLAAVCLDRGFEIRRGDGVALTRDDLLQAASRCVQLEQELNDVLDDLPPELAVELESEIERMKSEKERLEMEQARMLKEKDSLERQLREAGLDVPENSITSTRGGGGAGADTPETLEDVLRTSFTMLFDRVGRDMNLVGKVLSYVAIKPGTAALTVLWRYLGPTVEGLVERVLVVVDRVLATEFVVTVRRRIVEPLVETMLPVARPMVKQAISVVKMGLIQLDTIEPVHKCIVVAGAVLGPLQNSLLIGWRNSFQPKLMIARRKSSAWWKRIRTETRTKQQQQQLQQQL